MLLSEREALQRLEDAIQAAGSLKAFAELCGVTPSQVSNMRAASQAVRKQPINGNVALQLRMKRIAAYEVVENAKDPKQEHYEKERLEWNKTHGLPSEQSKTMRVAGKGVMGQRFPDQ